MSSPAGVIHDIGYRRYTGPRLGREYGIRSLYVHSLRTAYGFGRSAGAKVIPWIVFGILLAWAAILVAIQSQIQAAVPGEPIEQIFEYWQYPTNVNIFVLLFCAIAAPALVSRDLKGGVLQLYFSRPLVRSDYPFAKWAALVSSIFLLLLAPLLLLFLGSAFSLSSMTEVWHEFVEFSQGLVTAAIMSALFASISLLIASLSGRRAVASALIAGFFILTAPVLAVLQGIAYGTTNGEPTGGMLQLAQLSFLVSPLSIVQGLGSWLFDDGTPFIGPYGPLYFAVTFGIILLCLVLTLLRYRKVAR
jgi:ABC-2 type transport system permease protein